MKTDMISIKSIQKSFRDTNILKDISFDADAGSCVGIIGDNGSGKSTLLDILAGCSVPDGGSFTCNGVNLFENKTALSEIIGYVPQENVLFEELSAMDNLLFWYDRNVIEESSKEGILYDLGIPEMKRKIVRKMSGGMKKRLAIACAAAKRPDILLMDEPSASLDRNGKDFILEFLKNYKRDSGIIILSTHEESEMELCDSLYRIEGGVLTKLR